MLFILFFGSQVLAGEQCYSQDEMHAEQLLRLHSELMVITVTCHRSSVGEDLVPKYTGFTRRNIHVLHEAEQTLIRYYHTAFGGDGIPRLDKLRTRLANEYGQQIADMSAPAFCEERRDKPLAMYTANPDQIDLEVERMMTSEKSYAQLCGDSSMRIAKRK